MTHPARTPLSPLPTRWALLACLILAFAPGCGDEAADEPTVEAECSGHGERHLGHCHCDPGYEESEDSRSCLEEANNDHTNNDPNNHDHNNHNNNHNNEHNNHNNHNNAHNNNTHNNPDAPTDLSFMPEELLASTGLADDDSQVWLLEALDGTTALSLQLYAAFGAPTSPSTVALSEADTSYATCGTCLILQTGCEPHDGHLHCERTFMPRAEGTLRIDAIGPDAGDALTGALAGIVFEEVTIAQDFSTTRVSGGQQLHLDAWSFEATLDALQSSEECGGHGHLHGEDCHCDTGYRVDDNDPTQCVPE